MPTRSDLKTLAALRLREAEALYAAGLYDGAVYLAGYVVEMALKARICRLLGVNDYPSGSPYKSAYATHDLDQLLFLAGLKARMNPGNAPLFANWSVALPWRPDRRYIAPGAVAQQDALDILDAIRAPQNGVLRWIKKYW